MRKPDDIHFYNRMRLLIYGMFALMCVWASSNSTGHMISLPGLLAFVGVVLVVEIFWFPNIKDQMIVAAKDWEKEEKLEELQRQRDEAVEEITKKIDKEFEKAKKEL